MNQNSNPDNWLVIINPNAGNGKGKKDWERISSLLRAEGLMSTARFTEKKGHAVILALEAITEGYRRIITVGGDGTLNEVVNGVFQNRICPTAEVSLGLIPVGTGNDWGRMFGIPLDYSKAIKIIGENKKMLHDIGVIEFSEGTERKKRYFINIAGLGFESVVVKRTNYQKEKGRSGKTIYFFNLLMTLFSYRNTKANISIDSKNIDADLFSINIGNGRYCGGGMRQTPDALPDDGFLDVTIINGMGKLEIIRNLKILYDGTILNHPKIDGYRGKRISVSSDTLIYVEADGESLGHTPVEFSIIPSCINIIYHTRIIQ